MAGEPEPRDAAIAWERDSLEVISSFPAHVKQNLGYQLRLLQKGERPLDYRPVASIGSGVFELREEDKRGWYRVIYLSRINDVIYVLHCFEKKSRELPRNDAQIAKHRLKGVKARIADERKHANRGD